MTGVFTTSPCNTLHSRRHGCHVLGMGFGWRASRASDFPSRCPFPSSVHCFSSRRDKALPRGIAPTGRVDVVRKPSFVPHAGHPACGGGHSSRAAIAGRLEQPTRVLGRVSLRELSFPFGPERHRTHAYVALLPMGSALPLLLPGTRWALTPPFHPCLPRFESGQVVSSLLHFPSRSRDRALPGIVLCGARTFLPSLSRPAITWTASTGRKVTPAAGFGNGG